MEQHIKALTHQINLDTILSICEKHGISQEVILHFQKIEWSRDNAPTSLKS